MVRSPTTGRRSIHVYNDQIEEAQAKLKELIHQLAPGKEVIITENQQPVAKLVNQPPKPNAGLGKGFITVISDDDEHLKDFENYMP